MTSLLDTHILLWWLENQRRLSRRQRRIIESGGADDPLMVSDISLWEIATLFELGRIQLTIPLRDWLDRATAAPLVRRCSISPAIASEVATLPSSFHRDPADRIIVATARVHGAVLLTSDQRIISASLVTTVS